MLAVLNKDEHSLDELTTYLHEIKQEIEKHTMARQNYKGMQYTGISALVGLLVTCTVGYLLLENTPIADLALAGVVVGTIVGNLVSQWRGTWISSDIMKQANEGEALFKKHSSM